jgi:hypothetical protein
MGKYNSLEKEIRMPTTSHCLEVQTRLNFCVDMLPFLSTHRFIETFTYVSYIPSHRMRT